MVNYYYNIAFNIPLNKFFLYKSNLNLEIGIRIIANLHGKNKTGLIIKKFLKDNCEIEKNLTYKIKDIIEIIDEIPIINKHNIDLAIWISNRTFVSFGETIFFGLPKKIKNKTISKIKKEDFKYDQTKTILNNEQNEAYEKIINTKQNIFYLFGVPGSGKTEIFIKLCEYHLKKNKQILFLIPEILLGYQIIKRLKNSLNSNKIYEYNSSISSLNKLDIWQKIKANENLIVVGVKSVLMLPFTNLGLIIMDEEHENTYKSENIPKFHARHVSFYLHKKFNAKFIMGSATPSLEAYFSMENKKIEQIKLNNKIFKNEVKELKIINMKNERHLISDQLLYSIQKSIEAKRQSLLFINKKGYSKNLECKNCGYIICCSNCSFNLTYYQKEDKLLCHYCSYNIESIKTCPKCESIDIKYKSYGIEFIEKEIKKFFPHVSIAHIDSNKNKKDIINIINNFENRNIDILIGTQIIAKGFNFKQIQTLGIINADIGMGLPDFRSSERIFTLITQIIGRAARFQNDNCIIIQTYNPNYYAIKYAYKNQYKKFYEEEIKTRKLLGYPPFSKIIRIVFKSIKNIKAYEKAKEFFQISKEFLNEDITYLGPCEAVIFKIAKNFRYNIIYLSKNQKILEKLIREVKSKIRINNDVKIEIDYYPSSLL